jgi:hypothetical protein
MLQTIPLPSWAASLQDFTRRNAGRRALLEVDDYDFGAQQQSNMPLMGVAYDRYDGRIEIMLGETEADASHHTRSIGAARSVDILTDKHGRDQALRIEHGRAQTLLVFLE